MPPRPAGDPKGIRIDLDGHPAPPRPWTRPRHTAAEVRWSDGQWRPCEIVAWYRLPAPQTELMSGRTVEWLVRLRTVSEDAWWGYRPGWLRVRRDG